MKPNLWSNCSIVLIFGNATDGIGHKYWLNTNGTMRECKVSGYSCSNMCLPGNQLLLGQQH